MKRLRLLRDQRGMTLIELLVATSAGAVIFFGLTMIVIASMHQTTRVTNRVHSTQEARVVVQRLVSELQSSCIASGLAPIQSGSSGTKLIYISQKDGEKAEVVSPTPVKREVSLNGTNLTESIYEREGTATSPPWTFKSTAAATRTLMTRVGAVSTSIPIFRYYAFSGGQVASSPLAVPLEKGLEAEATQVNVALKVTPPKATVQDAKSAAVIQDSALLRFTSPAFATAGSNLPCE